MRARPTEDPVIIALREREKERARESALDLERRFSYHPADDAGKASAHAAVRHACWELAYFLRGALPEGREHALAITKLEEVMFWANAAVARQGDGDGSRG